MNEKLLLIKVGVRRHRESPYMTCIKSVEEGCVS